MTPGEITAIVGAGAALAGVVFTYIRGRTSDKTNEKKVATESQASAFEQNLALQKYIDGRVDAAVQPLKDEVRGLVERESTRTNAFIRILRSIAQQWPAGFPRPRLNPADIAAVEETIPHEWLGPDEEGPGQS